MQSGPSIVAQSTDGELIFNESMPTMTPLETNETEPGSPLAKKLAAMDGAATRKLAREERRDKFIEDELARLR